MINFWCRWPIELRLGLTAFFSLLVASQLNRAIDRLAYQPRGLDPWQDAPDSQPARSWSDRIPLLGWWRLRRESVCHGGLFWLRPFLIELLFPIAMTGLYLFETAGGLYPAGGPVAASDVLHAQFATHGVLIALMTVATFIDFDEQTIPDEVTLLGTAFAVVWISLLPFATLPAVVSVGFVPQAFHVVLTTSNHEQMWTHGLGGPFSWPIWLSEWQGLAIGLACLAAWWLGALPKIWTMRKGPIGAVRIAIASVVKYRTWKLSGFAAVLMLVACLIGFVRGDDYWQATLSSLVGMAAAGGFTWSIRLVASRALQTEALGFGDVTLMAMLGAFLGWQTSLLVFFLAPITALFVAVAQWLITRRHDIAFGPYLCLAAVVLLVFWRQLWFGWAVPVFGMGWVLPAIVAIALVMLGVMLSVWQMIKSTFA